LKDAEKWGVGRKRQGKVIEGVDWIKVKHTYRGDTLRNPFEH
jgi:hypothetical protein